MDRLIGLVALLLFVCLLMPTLAAYAIKTVPVLVSLSCSSSGSSGCCYPRAPGEGRECVERQFLAFSLVLASHTNQTGLVAYTNQRFHMTPSFHVVPERREPPDLERFVAALVAFVLARMEAEEAAAAKEQAERDD